jgi:sugar O-acyltransferase (sialic acid O-acetyltransferase NeuD family)
MKRLAILGASGHGKVVADTALSAGWAEVVFFDDGWPGLQANGHWPVVGDTRSLMERLAGFDGAIVAIGRNEVRLEKTRALERAGAKLVSLVHPSAVISTHAVVGPGSVVFAGAVIQVDSRLGKACIVNTGATLDHDCTLGDAVHICPGVNLAGGVQVGDLAWVGIGSSVKQLVRIGSRVTVGAGAAVISDVADGDTVVGVPARALGGR